MPRLLQYVSSHKIHVHVTNWPWKKCTPLVVLLHGTVGENKSMHKCIQPLNDSIVKAETTYDFRRLLNVEVHRPKTEVGRTSFKHRAALS